MSLYSVTKEKVNPRRKIGVDLRLKIPRFSEIERERDIGVFMGGVSQNAVAKGNRNMRGCVTLCLLKTKLSMIKT